MPMHVLSKKSGVAYAAVHGFWTADRRLSLRSAAQLAAVLKLEIRPIRRKKRNHG